MNSKHPGWQEVLDALERPGASSRPILEHLEGCPSCREMRREVERLLEQLARARAPRPPADLLERALAAIIAEADPWARVRAFFAAGLRAVQATLAADSLAPSAAFRGAAVAEPRLLLYESPSHSISISLAAGQARGTVELRGQVMPRSADALPPGGRAILVSPADHAECPLSEFGEFFFTAAPRAPLRLAIELAGERLEAGPFGDLAGG